MDDMDLNLYIMAELQYKKIHNDSDDIFPIDWYSTQNYKLKTEIIAEAIKKNIDIEETELYQKNMVEGITD